MAFALLLWGFTSGVSVRHILLHRREPASAVLWLAISLTLPLVGPFLYVLVGNHRIVRRARVRLGRRAQLRPQVQKAFLDRDPGLEAAELGGQLPGLMAVLCALGRMPARGGNRVVPLRDGAEAFPQMLDAIATARRSVLLQSYIFDTDAVGLQFLGALAQATRRGVHCRVLYDAIGSIEIDADALARAEADGVPVRAFAPRDWLAGRFQLNLRNHRKLLVVDGVRAFVGGINISARHVPDEGGRLDTTDWHFLVEGPVVPSLSACFVEDWHFATGEALLGEGWHSVPEPRGEDVCRAVPNGPDEQHEVHHALLLTAIHEAQRSVRLATPYFLPDRPLRDALRLAALRGVVVQVVVPDRTDHPYAGWAMEAFYDELLDAGLHLRRRPGPFLHAKLTVIDGQWAFVGSGNLDPRSFRLNFELNLSVVGPAVESIDAAWQSLWKDATPMDITSRRRPAWRHAWENFWALWSPLL
jgi:cardiolipin synthase